METKTFIENALAVLGVERNLQIIVAYYIGKKPCVVGYGRNLLPTIWYHIGLGNPVLSVAFEVYHGDDAPDPGLATLPFSQPPTQVIEDGKRKVVSIIFEF